MPTRDLLTAYGRRDLLRTIGFTGGLATVAGCGASETQPAASVPTSAPKPTGAPKPASTVQAAAIVTASPVVAKVPEVKGLKVGYLPITDATPLLVAHNQGLFAAEGLEVEKPTLFRSWAQIAEAFQAKQVDVAHLLMPAAIWMRFGQNFPVKVVAWNHVDGSALTVAKNVDSLGDLAGKVIGIPFWYSIHNLVVQLLLRTAGLKPILTGEPDARAKTVKLSILAPADMPPALAAGTIAGYIVADPFNAVAEVQGIGKVLRFTGDAWLNHACCVTIVHEDAVRERPRWTQAVVTGLAKAQRYARENRKETARILSKEGGDYLPQPLPAIERALTGYSREEYGASKAIVHPDWANNRIDFQPFPFPSYTAELVKLLRDTEVDGDAAFLKTLDPAQAHGTLVDDTFARAAISAAGGPSVFGLPENLSRVEKIVP
jgi:NitT/TauT family transport system substrate-binding protein